MLNYDENGENMNLILNDIIKNKFKINDFGLDPINKKIILSGEKLIFLNNNVVEKEISGKLKNCEVIRFIKEENQLFISNNFYVSTRSGKVFSCDASKKKVIECVFEKSANIDSIEFTSTGNIVFIENNILYSHNVKTNKVMKYNIDGNLSAKHKIFISNDNIILKYREIHNHKNNITILNEILDVVLSIVTDKNHIYSKTVDLYYIAGTDDGEIEIWDTISGELYNSIKLSKFRISYIEYIKKEIYIGTSNGDIIVLDSKFNIINTFNVCKYEIKKIESINDKLYVLNDENEIYIYDIIDYKTIEQEIEYREEFLSKRNISLDYLDFFTLDKIETISNFINSLNLNKINYVPNEENIFKALSNSVNNIKICLIGKDPYFQPGVATGLAFEVNKDSWLDPEVNTSLKNMLKLIYKSYTDNYLDINEIREKIRLKEFKILAPNEIFKSWQNQGVLLLNAALTTVEGDSGRHHKFWNQITEKILEYISLKNSHIIYLLWGKDAQIFEKNLKSGTIIKHNHPAICGDLSNENDFMNGKSFQETKHIINWLG